MRQTTNAYKILDGKSEGKRPLDLGVDGKRIFECMLGKQGGKLRTGCTWLRIGTRDGLL
jgi:hypothetical protein